MSVGRSGSRRCRSSTVGSTRPSRRAPGTLAPWSIRTGGLTLVFEGQSEASSALTNWTYSGGPVAGFTELVAPNGIRIGDNRADVAAAHPGATDLGDEVAVASPVVLRFAMDEDVVESFGIIDCVFEGQPSEGT